LCGTTGIQWIFNDINIPFQNIARLKRLMLKCCFDIFILLLTLSCRNLWQNQLGKFWCGLTGWQLTLLGLKSAEGQTVRPKKQAAITRISECLKVKRSELVSFSHCSKADLSINFKPSL